MPDIKYRPAVITFLDIIGFKNIIYSKSAEEVYTAVSELVDIASPLGDDFGDEEIESTVSIAFSDSIIRVRHYDAEYSSGALFHEVLSLVHAQADLANRGILVRGGLTVGLIYIKDGTVFGPGLVKAYNLENDFANYPRIVVDPQAFEQLRSDPRLVSQDNDAEHDIHYIRKKVRLSDDGFWFIDYLAGIVSEMDNPETYPDFLEGHKKLILQNIRNAANNLGIMQKYFWLSQYHNKVCKESGNEEQIITQSDIPMMDPLIDKSGIDPDY